MDIQFIEVESHNRTPFCQMDLDRTNSSGLHPVTQQNKSKGMGESPLEDKLTGKQATADKARRLLDDSEGEWQTPAILAL